MTASRNMALDSDDHLPARSGRPRRLRKFMAASSSHQYTVLEIPGRLVFHMHDTPGSHGNHNGWCLSLTGIPS